VSAAAARAECRDPRACLRQSARGDAKTPSLDVPPSHPESRRADLAVATSGAPRRLPAGASLPRTSPARALTRARLPVGMSRPAWADPAALLSGRPGPIGFVCPSPHPDPVATPAPTPDLTAPLVSAPARAPSTVQVRFAKKLRHGPAPNGRRCPIGFVLPRARGRHPRAPWPMRIRRPDPPAPQAGSQIRPAIGFVLHERSRSGLAGWPPCQPPYQSSAAPLRRRAQPCRAVSPRRFVLQIGPHYHGPPTVGLPDLNRVSLRLCRMRRSPRAARPPSAWCARPDHDRPPQAARTS
jgi:hypothetical protein